MSHTMSHIVHDTLYHYIPLLLKCFEILKQFGIFDMFPDLVLISDLVSSSFTILSSSFLTSSDFMHIVLASSSSSDNSIV